MHLSSHILRNSSIELLNIESEEDYDKLLNELISTANEFGLKKWLSEIIERKDKMTNWDKG